MSQAGFILEGRSVELWPGSVPAGQLCGTAAIVEQNSFPMTHFNLIETTALSTFLALNLKEIRKEKVFYPHFVRNYLLTLSCEAAVYKENFKNTEREAHLITPIR